MRPSKQLINMSFVNPIVDFLPLILFNIVGNYWGLPIALYLSLPLAIILLAFAYNKQLAIFSWHVSISLLYILICGATLLVCLLPIFQHIQSIAFEIIASGVIVVLLSLQKPIKKLFLNNFRGIPMVNNLHEFFRTMRMFLFLLIFHISAWICCQYLWETSQVYGKINNLYTVLLVGAALYETVRVYMIRGQLGLEEWWPIVNKKGKVIGAVERKESLQNPGKYLHPVVRIIFVYNNRLLLRLRNSNDMFYPNLWDTTISSHVRYGETMEKCLERLVKKALNFHPSEHVEYKSYYTNMIQAGNAAIYYYVIQLKTELNMEIDPKYGQRLKWWTVKQIDDNICSGVFAELFMGEYPYLHIKKILS